VIYSNIAITAEAVATVDGDDWRAPSTVNDSKCYYFVEEQSLGKVFFITACYLYSAGPQSCYSRLAVNFSHFKYLSRSY
jgi:hypothetical protein